MEEVTLIDFSRSGMEQILKAEKGEYDQNKKVSVKNKNSNSLTYRGKNYGRQHYIF